MITQKQLKELLFYNPDTGYFSWLEDRPKGGHKAGVDIITENNRGYIYLNINRKKLEVHRLAWLYVYGELPVCQIDHIDGNPINNRIDNLRAVTRSENQKNRCLQKNNTSGILGVCWNKANSKWQVSCGKKYIGCFVEIWDAICARKSGDYKHGFHINHGNRGV